MIVTRSGFDEALKQLLKEPRLSIDTETTGLRMFHGDRFFSFIIAKNENEAFYFNFNPYTYSHVKNPDGTISEFKEPLPEDVVLTEEHVEKMASLWSDPSKLWYIQNAPNFDMGMLYQGRITLAGTIHCTRAIGRVEYNNLYGQFFKVYSLDNQLKRIGAPLKDDAVKAYVKEWKLETKKVIEGKEVTLQHFDRVPFTIIVPYGLVDAMRTWLLGDYQEKSIAKKDLEQPALGSQRSMRRVMDNERRLMKTIFNMKKTGIKIDRKYCERAIKYENDRIQKAEDNFKKETGLEFKDSGKVFELAFGNEKELWGVADKGGPSFDAECLKRLQNPAAKEVLQYRDAKSKSDFYKGFLYFADSDDIVHPDYNSEGTIHGRFSSSEPNFQNLTSEEDEEDLAQEFVVRRAIIPRPGNIFLLPDYVQMEYKFMLELACILMGHLTPLGELVNAGHDFHEATIRNTAKYGANIVRKQAKVANFLTLYGGGAPLLAANLGISVRDANVIRTAIFSAAPEIEKLLKTLQNSAKTRGYVINWMGRRCYFDNPSFAYKAPNYIVSGGCADIVKKAMNEIDSFLSGYRGNMVMTVHDELPIEVPEDEAHKLAQPILDIMDHTYPFKFIKINSSMEWSSKSLADKIKGLPG